MFSFFEWGNMNKLKTKLGNDNSLQVLGLDKTEKNTDWKAFSLTTGRILLSSTKNNSQIEDCSSFSFLEKSCFFNFLYGLNKNKWTGRVCIEPSLNISRNLYFLSGQLVFAESSLMDDSLGEVLYRNQLLSLEDLTKSATKVKKGVRFGEVLMDDRIMNYEELWDALQLQVTHILNGRFFFT